MSEIEKALEQILADCGTMAAQVGTLAVEQNVLRSVLCGVIDAVGHEPKLRDAIEHQLERAYAIYLGQPIADNVPRAFEDSARLFRLALAAAAERAR